MEKSLKAFNVEFSVPNFTILTKLKSFVTVQPGYKPFLTIQDVMQWCQSPEGVDYLLATCAQKSVDDIKKLGTDWERYTLAIKLLNEFTGFSPSDEKKEDGEPSDPLAEKSQIGN